MKRQGKWDGCVDENFVFRVAASPYFIKICGKPAMALWETGDCGTVEKMLLK